MGKRDAAPERDICMCANKDIPIRLSYMFYFNILIFFINLEIIFLILDYEFSHSQCAFLMNLKLNLPRIMGTLCAEYRF